MRRMGRSHVLSGAVGAILGVAATWTAPLVFGLGRPGASPPTVPPAAADVVQALNAAAERFERAAANMQVRGTHVVTQDSRGPRRPVPEPLPNAAPTDDVETLIERLETVVSLMARQATSRAGSEWDLHGIQSNLRSASGPRAGAVARVAAAYEENEDLVTRDYLFRTASDVIRTFGTPRRVYAQDSGALKLEYWVEGPATGLAAGSVADIDIRVLDGFVYRIHGSVAAR